MAFVPSRPSEVDDFLSYLVVYYPAGFPSEDRMDADLAFSTLVEGIDAIRGRLGEERHQDLRQMAEEARQLFAQGDERGGAFKFQDMQSRLRGRTTGRD